MDTTRELILKRLHELHSGMLRFSSGRQKLSLLVKVVDSTSSFVQFSNIEKKYQAKLINRRASFSQVTSKGYLHISGTVLGNDSETNPVLSLDISKAHWFEKKKRNNRRWLEETCFYR